MVKKDKTCGECGYMLSRFYETGMLGCPSCYRAFKTEMLAALKEVQGGNTRHTGKSPDDTDRTLLAEYKSLLSERENAVLEERFADSAALSERLFELSETLKERGLI